MQIIALDKGVRIIENNGDKQFFPANRFRVQFKDSQNATIQTLHIVESGTSVRAFKISKITEVTSIDDDRTGGPGSIAVPASLTLLYDTIEDFFFTDSVASALAGLATEPTLLSVLANIKDTQDVEILLVRDTGDSDLVVQQIRSYDQDTETFTTTFEKVDGSTHTEIGPLEYLDASAVLNLILSDLQLKADLTETQPVSLVSSDKKKMLDEADDLVKTFAYLDAGTDDERVSTIIYTSATLSLTATETFVYAGSTPNFRIATITLS